MFCCSEYVKKWAASWRGNGLVGLGEELAQHTVYHHDVWKRASQCAQEACGAPAHILILPPCEPLSGCSGLWEATTKQARTATRLCSQSAKGALYALTSSSQRQNLLWDHEEEGCIYCGKAVSRSCHGAWVSTKAHPQVGAEGRRRDTLRGEAWQKAGSLKGMPFKERMGF